MIFTSGTQQLQGRSVNHDPHPNVWSKHSPRDKMRVDTEMFRVGCSDKLEGYVRLPRPEFAVEDNPILVQYRADVRDAAMGEQENDVGDYEWLLGDHWENFWKELVTEEHVVHARKVLARLKSLEEM